MDGAASEEFTVVVIGNFRGRSELRKKPRRSFQYKSWLLTSEKEPLRRCSVLDISDIGARIELESDEELPAQFILGFTESGAGRRICEVVWRNGLIVGVKFLCRTRPTMAEY